MYVDIKKIKIWLVVILINLVLFQYATKVYQLNLLADSFRYIAIMILAISLVGRIFLSILIKPRYSGIFLLFFLYSLYIIFMLAIGSDFDLPTIMNCLFFPLTFLSSYFFNKEKSQFNKIIKIQFLLMIIFYILYLYSKFYLVNYNPLYNSLIINSIYYLVLLLPFIYSIDNLIMKFIGIICILSAVLISMKRTAFIAMIVSLAIYLLMDKAQNYNNAAKKIKKILFTLIAIAIFSVVYNYTASLGFDVFGRLALIESDGGSNRFKIFKLVFIAISKNNIFQMLFGNGYNAVAEATGGLSAHNDFLEILYDFGVIGLMFYMGIYLYLIKYAVIFSRKHYKYSAAFSASIYIFFFMSLSSHLIFIPTYVAFLAFFWGSCIYNYEYSLIDNDG